MKYKLKNFAKLAAIIGAAWWVNKKFRKVVKNMQQTNQITNVDVQNVIDRCTQSAQRIRNIANDVVDHRARYALAEADRQIELCIHTCLDAKAKANNA